MSEALSPQVNWVVRIVLVLLSLFGFYVMFSGLGFILGLFIIFLIFIIGTLLDSSARESQVMVPLE